MPTVCDERSGAGLLLGACKFLLLPGGQMMKTWTTVHCRANAKNSCVAFRRSEERAHVAGSKGIVH